MLSFVAGIDAMLSIKDVAAKLGVSVMTVRRLVWAGTLRAFKIGGRLKFDPEEVEQYLAEQRYHPEQRTGKKKEETQP